MTRRTIILMLVMVSAFTMAQIAPQKYFIEFKDKFNSHYSTTKPEEFLSSRAIERRQKQGIPIDQTDLPVNQTYVNKIMEYNIEVLTRSKWFNGVTIFCPDASIIDAILKLPFVKSIIKNSNSNFIYSSNSDNKFRLEEVTLEQMIIPNVVNYGIHSATSGFNYGPSYNQIHMLNGDSLHKLGYTGEGMVIAVLDAGFYKVNSLPAFDSLWFNNQILGARDFVVPGNDVYKEFEHGMEVLSCMGGNIPGQIIGTAPKAKYWLLRSEDTNSECLIEEFNWVAAAEFADSVGSDVINSSLGYTKFDDPSQNHSCSDMNGNTTPVALGANMAFAKGMIVVNSAGNNGATSWRCVSSPADGFMVLSVAAVDSNGIRAGFSSVGESSHRIKPNVAALGKGTVVSSTVGTIMYNSGTSFSSPVVAGLTACLWQAHPTQSNQSIVRAIELSGSQISNPDSLLGYGIPDYIKAGQHVQVEEKERLHLATVFPNPCTSEFSLSFYSDSRLQLNISLVNIFGARVFTMQKYEVRVGRNEITFPDLGYLPDGNYILTITGNDFRLIKKITKTPK